MSAPVSQISAAALPAGTEQLGLVAAFPQRPDDARASGLRMSAVLLEDESQMLSDELGTRDPTFLRSPGEQPVVLRIQRDGGRLLFRECHGSNMTRRVPSVNIHTASNQEPGSKGRASGRSEENASALIGGGRAGRG